MNYKSGEKYKVIRKNGNKEVAVITITEGHCEKIMARKIFFLYGLKMNDIRLIKLD